MNKTTRKIVTLALITIMLSAILGGCQKSENKEIIDVINYTADSDYKPSDFIQEDIDSDTVQWICASYAIFNQVNEKELNMIGGMLDDYGDYEELIVLKMQNELEAGWEISNRKTAMEQLRWLVEEGHSKAYIELAMKMKDDKVTDESNLNNRGMTVQQAYKQFGEDGLTGWDLTRALQVIGDCYHAEYINLEEALDLSLPIAVKLQSTFDNWDEVAESYLYGYQYWQKEAPDDKASETSVRRETYEELAADQEGPYQISYDTKLVSNWDKEAVSKAKQEKEKREQEEKEKDELKPPQKNKNGEYTIRNYETSVTEKVKLPEGFVEDEESVDFLVKAVNKEKELNISYSVDTCENEESVDNLIFASRLYVTENGYENLEIVKEELEQDQSPLRFYAFVTFDVNGEKKQGNVGYLFYKLENGSYQGVLVQLTGAGVLNLSEEEALDIMFSGVEIN